MSILQRLRRLIPRTRRGRWRVYIYGTIVLIPALDMLYVQWQRHIPLGRDTTYIDAPLKPDGYPDYVAWFNKLRGEGVKPEDNAAIPIYEMSYPGKTNSNYYQGLRAA